jgi:hypothetical protein
VLTKIVNNYIRVRKVWQLFTVGKALFQVIQRSENSFLKAKLKKIKMKMRPSGPLQKINQIRKWL